ncbi:MAG TPA: hypothetical protein DCL69_03470, partial [Firmicutes bacterium]|nr:hypothetical protein [Bacillota bacterium]
ETQKKEHDWEFIFLGANIDAISTAARIGIGASRAANYHADNQGTKKNFDAISEAVSCLRQNCTIAEGWKEEIDADFKSRGSKGSKRNFLATHFQTV